VGFFYSANKPERLTGASKQSALLLHRAGCNACPLDKAKCKHPKMEPSGAGPIYILGANPTAEADRAGYPIVGYSKDALLGQVPRKLRGSLRYNNIVRTAAGKALTSVMIECCRPSIIADIEAEQPKAIIGLGEQVLNWVLNQTGIKKWTGRHIPVKIGKHVCWFFPISDPVELLKTQKFEWSESEEQFAWKLQVERAFATIAELEEAPEPHDADYARSGIISVDGSNGEADLKLVADTLARLANESVVGFDWETNRLRGYNAGSKLLTAAIAGRNECLAVAIDHSRALWSRKQRVALRRLLEDWLWTAVCRKVSHNLAFELEWAALNFGNGVVRATRWEDTITQAWLLDERQKMGKPDALSLEFLTIQYFGFNLKSLNQLETDDLDNAPLDIVLEYNGMDAKYHRSLYLRQAYRIKHEGFTEQYEQMLARIPTCVLTQIKGVPISQAKVLSFKKYYEDNLVMIEEDIQHTEAAKQFKKAFGKTFQPGNSAQTLKLITEVLGESAANKQEKQSAGLEVLERIDDPIAPLILEWRNDAKALSTYVLPVLKGSEHVYEDGLIHPNISTTSTDTSRTSSDKPNSQNWPKRKRSKIIRSQIAPLNKAERLVSFDYAGIQARNIAMESLDDTLIQSFWTGYDPHGVWTKWLAEKAGTDWKYVSASGSTKAFLADKNQFKSARSTVKNSFVFPSFFGAQSRSISINLDIEQSIIEQMQEELFGEFPDVKVWQDSIKEHYAEHGWVAGLTGIKRRAPCSPNQLINAPIQADEAWIVCDAFTRLSILAEDDWDLQPNMEIHDDLTFIWHKDRIDELAPIVIRELIAAIAERITND
jgi:uracil-DNA glycosylase family 4